MACSSPPEAARACAFPDFALVPLYGTSVSTRASAAGQVLTDLGSARRAEGALARLSELVVDFSTAIQQHLLSGPDTEPLARVRLRGAIATAGVPLPRCDELLELDRTSDPKVITPAASAALDELAQAMRSRGRLEFLG